MKKEIMLVAAVIALVAFSGCLSKQETTTAFVGGTNGLTMQFQNLPATVFSNTPFNIMVLVNNEGESNILANNATFLLNNAQVLGITSDVIQKNSKALAGSKKIGTSIIPGSPQLINWTGAKFSGTVLTEQQKVTVSVEACYPYNSLGIASVCVARTDKICNPIGDKSVQSSGAPVKFTSFKQLAQSNDAETVHLEITAGIENQGDGKVYSNSVDSQCPSPKVDYLDMVYVLGIKLGNKAITSLKCDENPITLYENKGEINCGFDVSTTADFEEQLSIELAYKYKNKISSEIAVIPKSGNLK